LLWSNIRAALAAAYTKGARVRLASVALVVGGLAPLGLLLAGGSVLALAATLLIGLAALASRAEIVRFPHLTHARGR
jgi:hypothetical protein